MKSVFDGHEVSLNCPKCGKRTSHAIGKLKTSPKINCPACDAAIKIKADTRGLREADKALENFRKRIRRMSGKLKF